MKLDAVALKIRTAETDLGNNIAGAAELAIAEDGKFSTPAAFVVQTDEVAEDSQSELHVLQELNEGFAVVVALDNSADRTGNTAYNELHGIRAQLWTALLGWIPTGHEGPIFYKGGTVQAITRECLWYRFDFTVPSRIQPEDGHSEDFDDDFEMIYAQYAVDKTNLVILGDFPENNLEDDPIDYTAIWTTGDGWNIADDKASCDGTQAAISDLSQNIPVSIGTAYGIYLEVTVEAGTITPYLGATAGDDITETGTYENKYLTAMGDSVLRLRASADFVGSVDNVAIYPMDIIEIEQE